MSEQNGTPVPHLPLGGLMKGKRALITGVANERSIAWAIAEAFKAEGAELAFTYPGEAMGKRVRPLAEQLGAQAIIDLDVSKDEDLDRLFTVNVKGALACSRAATKSMMRAKTGRIIFMSSVVGEIRKDESERPDPAMQQADDATEDEEVAQRHARLTGEAQ